jgi:hypothetical protein
METQYLEIDFLGCWQRVRAPKEGRWCAAWTHDGSERHDRSVKENGTDAKLNTI